MVDIAAAGAVSRERLRELYAYRELVANLTARDLRLKYKGSVLGVGWSLLNPILQMAVYTAIFGLFLRIFTLPNYWAFVIGGIIAWTFFNSSLTAASVAFVRNPGLISKVYFPIESLPISMILANFINFVIPLALLIGVELAAGIHLGPSLVLLPVIAVAELALCIGLGLLVSTVTVYLRDVEHFLMLGLQVLFYATPVLYPLTRSALPRGAGRYIAILHLNPLAWYLDSYHAVLFFGTWPSPADFGPMLVFSLVALVGGFGVFVWLRPWVPEAV